MMLRVYVAKSTQGKGLFAARPINRGKRVAVFTGRRFQNRKNNLLPISVASHAIQIGPHTWIDKKKSIARFANHSCTPNIGIKGLRQLVALRGIKKDEELRWDYSTTENSDWHLRCRCGSRTCRKIIGPWDELPPAIKRSYLRRGIVSSWIVRRMEKI